jgi:hypothetical protein
LIVLHFGGHEANIPGFRALADEHGVGLIEDGCHAPSGTVEYKKLASFGYVACYSLYSNKNLAIREGGMLITNNPELAREERSKSAALDCCLVSLVDGIKISVGLLSPAGRPLRLFCPFPICTHNCLLFRFLECFKR